jgi:hypothetical protein
MKWELISVDPAPDMYLCFCGEASDTKRIIVSA